MTGAPTATAPSSCPGPPYRSAYGGFVTGPNTCGRSSARGPSHQDPVQIYSFQDLGRKGSAAALHGAPKSSSTCSALSDLPMRLNNHAVLRAANSLYLFTGLGNTMNQGLYLSSTRPSGGHHLYILPY
jgi:hypothetical protein